VLVDTADTNHQSDLLFCWNVKSTIGLGFAKSINLGPLLSEVLLVIGFTFGEPFLFFLGKISSPLSIGFFFLLLVFFLKGFLFFQQLRAG